MSTIPPTSVPTEYSKSFATVSVPDAVAAESREVGRSGRVRPQLMMTKILLKGGHSTTIHGRSPSDLSEEIALAARTTAACDFWFVHHHDDYGGEPNGVAIEPRSVIGLVRIS